MEKENNEETDEEEDEKNQIFYAFLEIVSGRCKIRIFRTKRNEIIIFSYENFINQNLCHNYSASRLLFYLHTYKLILVPLRTHSG